MQVRFVKQNITKDASITLIYTKNIVNFDICNGSLSDDQIRTQSIGNKYLYDT